MDFTSVLPPEIICKIFDYLEIKSLRIVRSVCRRWNNCVENQLNHKNMTKKLEKSWKNDFPQKRRIKTHNTPNEYRWQRNCCSSNRVSFQGTIVNDTINAFVYEQDNFLRIYDISKTSNSDSKYQLRKQIYIPSSWTNFSFDIDGSIFALIYTTYGHSELGHSGPFLKMFERKNLKLISTFDNKSCCAAFKKVGRLGDSRTHLKLFNDYLLVNYHSMPSSYYSKIDVYKKICKRGKSGNKYSFQIIKCVEKINFYDLEYLGQKTSHLLVRAKKSKCSEKYEYLQLDEQFPVSSDHLYEVGFCNFFQILHLQKEAVKVVRKFAIHSRIQVCAIHFPLIVYYFEDINSIHTIIENGEFVFIEDTLLQVYDLKKKKQLKSFRITGNNYIHNCRADDQHFVLEIRNSLIDKILSHKYQSSLWIWETKDLLDLSMHSQSSMEKARRVVNFEICRHSSDYKIFFSDDMYDVDSEIMIQNYKGIQSSQLMKIDETEFELRQDENNNVTKSIVYFELGSLTKCSLSAYVTSNGCYKKKHEILLFDFGY